MNDVQLIGMRATPAQTLPRRDEGQSNRNAIF